jgi:hypothetical protein
LIDSKLKALRSSNSHEVFCSSTTSAPSKLSSSSPHPASTRDAAKNARTRRPCESCLARQRPGDSRVLTMPIFGMSLLLFVAKLTVGLARALPTGTCRTRDYSMLLGSVQTFDSKPRWTDGTHSRAPNRDGLQDGLISPARGL